MSLVFLVFSVLLHGSQGFAKGKSILLIGDSHTAGFFGMALDQSLRKLSDKVTSIGSCGSSPSNWTQSDSKFQQTNCGFWKKNSEGKITSSQKHTTPSFSEALKETQPDVTIIALGTNMLSSPSDIKRELKFIEAMLKKTRESRSQCIWIGPPNLAKDPFRANLLSGISQMKSLIEKSHCEFIDSNNFTRYPSSVKRSDGIHYPKNQAIEWATKIQPSLESFINKTEAHRSDETDAVQSSEGHP